MVKKKKDATSDVYTGYHEIKTERLKLWEQSKSDEWREYRKKWVDYPKNLRIPDFPFHLGIGVSSACNLMCPMCARTMKIKDGSFRNSLNMNFDIFKKIIDEAAEKGVYAVSLNGYGEALMNPRFFDMVKYAKNKGIIDVFFHTNAVLLTEELSIKLVDAQIDKVIVSFDSPYKKKYEELRKGANFESVVDNVRKLFEYRQAKGDVNPLIRINMIEFPELTDREVEDMKELFLPIVDCIGFLKLSDHTKMRPSYEEGYKSRFICPQLITRLTICEDGLVYSCCHTLHESLSLGNIKDQSLTELWEGTKLKALREKHKAGEFYDIPGCLTCSWAVQEDQRLKEKTI